MKLGLYPTGQGPADVAAVREAERLGFDSIWIAEAYGLDALTPMAWWAGQTTTIGLGTIVCVVDARTPAATAMAAMTLDHLSGGRFTLGLGVSGPVVVEGWYGRPFRKPLARTREYIEVVRSIQARDAKVAYDGEFFQLPFTGDGAMGLGAPLKSSHRPLRPHQPLFLAAEGPKAIALSAEVADGWTAFYVSPHSDAYYRERLEEGFARRPGGRPASFEVLAQVHVAIDDDVERAADHVRGNIALFVGGMGKPGANFHYDTLARIGFEAECAAISRLWAAGDRAGAAASIPLALVESIALVGPVAKIRDELPAWRASCISLMLPMVHTAPVDERLVGELAELFLGG
ncbi:MAG TPA: LLM class F420-dependent oxidoreductase [Mycobacteriales bacterium]|nr:LLM class F420-dependent oxidoreductase [Mycobacteriales bacterium]